MNMLEEQKNSLDYISIKYHEFKSRFNKTHKQVYAFVEGPDDQTIYTSIINNLIPNDWKVDVVYLNGKDKVFDMYQKFQWDMYSKNQIAFFIDRDLSDFLDVKIPKDINIYVTDNYSIENDFVNTETCERILKEVFQFHVLSNEDIRLILDFFDKQHNYFRESIVIIMVWMIAWSRNQIKANIGDIKLDTMFSFKKEGITLNENYKELTRIEEYIHQRCLRCNRLDLKIDDISNEFKTASKSRCLIRGKFELWFLVKCTNSIYQYIDSLLPGVKISKVHITFHEKNALLLISGRSRISISLREFIKFTFMGFINQWESKH